MTSNDEWQAMRDAKNLTLELHANQLRGEELRAQRQEAFTDLWVLNWTLAEIAKVVDLTAARVGQIIKENAAPITPEILEEFGEI